MTQTNVKEGARKPANMAPKPKAAVPQPVKNAPTHEQIAERAKAIWQAKGCPQGKDKEIWLEAEKQLNNALGRS